MSGLLKGLLSSNDKNKISFELANLLKRKFGENVILIDVRTPEEFESGYIKDAINIPLDNIADYNKFKSENLYIVYCRSGARAEKARVILESKGLDAVNAGGVMDYSGELVK